MQLLKVFKSVEDATEKRVTNSAEIEMEADVDQDEAMDQMWLASCVDLRSCCMNT